MERVKVAAARLHRDISRSTVPHASEIKARSNRATMLAWFLPFTGCEAVAVSSGRFSTFATAVSSLQESMIAQAKAADPAAKWIVDHIAARPALWRMAAFGRKDASA